MRGEEYVWLEETIENKVLLFVNRMTELLKLKRDGIEERRDAHA